MKARKATHYMRKKKRHVHLRYQEQYLLLEVSEISPWATAKNSHPSSKGRTLRWWLENC